MERLTIKNSDGTYSQPTHTTFEKMFYKLAEFEDFMEENEFYDLQSLKDTLYQANMELYKMKTLKDRWQRLKEYIKENMEDDNNPEEEWCVLHRVSKKMQELENGE